MCNLAGYSGIRKANINIIKLLAIYGRERGTDGFGCWMGNELFKAGGYNKEGDSYHILQGVVVNRTLGTSNTILLHNRAKSVGYVNKDNAHPYVFDYIEGKKYIFAHNGTISNIDALCEKYNINQPVGSTDSYCLGKIIYEHGFDVLKEYRGFAALTVLDLNTDILYLWKGFSQCESVTATEERPLHIYNKKNMLYYSSEAVTLTTALNTRRDIKSLAPNILFSVKDGNIVDGVEYDRSRIVYVAPVYDWAAERAKNYPTNHIPLGGNIDNAYSKAASAATYIPEPNPQAESKGKIYCYQGQYWKNGHILKGAYMVEEDGKCYQVTGKELELYKTNNPSFVSKIKFFIDGYMMKSEDVYKDVVTKNIKMTDVMAFDWAQKLHDNTVLFTKVGPRYSLYFNGHYQANAAVLPMFSKYKYISKNGSIESVLNEDVLELYNIKATKTTDEYYDEYYANFQ